MFPTLPASLCLILAGVVYTSQVRVKAVFLPVSNAHPRAKERDLSAGICKNSKRASLGLSAHWRGNRIRDLWAVAAAFLLLITPPSLRSEKEIFAHVCHWH